MAAAAVAVVGSVGVVVEERAVCMLGAVEAGEWGFMVKLIEQILMSISTTHHDDDDDAHTAAKILLLCRGRSYLVDGVL